MIKTVENKEKNSPTAPSRKEKSRLPATGLQNVARRVAVWCIVPVQEGEKDRKRKKKKKNLVHEQKVFLIPHFKKGRGKEKTLRAARLCGLSLPRHRRGPS